MRDSLIEISFNFFFIIMKTKIFVCTIPNTFLERVKSLFMKKKNKIVLIHWEDTKFNNNFSEPTSVYDRRSGKYTKWISWELFWLSDAERILWENIELCLSFFWFHNPYWSDGPQYNDYYVEDLYKLTNKKWRHLIRVIKNDN